MAGDHVQRAAADRAGGAEHDEAHAATRAIGSSSAATGRAAVMLSMRSGMPPGPGRRAPLSLTPASRLAADSNRSPATPMAPSNAAAPGTDPPEMPPAQ